MLRPPKILLNRPATATPVLQDLCLFIVSISFPLVLYCVQKPFFRRISYLGHVDTVPLRVPISIVFRTC